MSLFDDDRPDTGLRTAQAFAPVVPSEPVSSGLEGAPAVMREDRPNLLPVALLAGAGAALAGGLAWAGVVIVTHFDIGFLAWFVGAATGLAIVRVAGGPVGYPARVSAGLLAAGGIMAGKYVIFVYAVKKTFGAELAAHGLSVGYLDTRQMSIFLHNIGSIVQPVYFLWVALAFFAAVRTAGGRSLLARRLR